ncbi:MAG TPA: hypothetical protein VHK86_01470 [Nitrososphaera sp.]|nr:hypothetical protein [Nitrososphaera sp.]
MEFITRTDHNGLQEHLQEISGKATGKLEPLQLGAKAMPSLRLVSCLGWQELPMLQLPAENPKEKRLAHKMQCSAYTPFKNKNSAIKNKMSSAATLVDKEYESIVGNLASQHPILDPYLLIKSAMLRKKYPLESKQHFWLDLYCKEGAKTSEVGARIFSKVGRFPSYHGHNHFVLDIEAGLDTLLEIASNSDIDRIEGTVYPLSA